MSNFSVNSTQPVPAVPPAAPAARPAKPAAAPVQLRDPAHLVPTDRNQTQTPAAGGAVHTVELVDGAPSKEDMAWAQQLQEQVKQGYEPTDAEVTRYHNIEADITWAQQLEAKAAEGYQATPAEVERYHQILKVVNPEAAAQLEATLAQQQAPAAPARPQPASPQTPAATPQAGPAPQSPATQIATQVPAPQAPAQQPAPVPQAGPAPQQPAKPGPAEIKVRFQQLDDLLNKKQYIVFGKVADPDSVRQTAVGIWLDGSAADKLQLAKQLVDHDQSEVLGRVLAHQETSELETAQLMSQADFPVAKFMNDLDDSHAFLVLKSLASVAGTGEPSSARVLEKTVAAYDKLWDREAPFRQLKADLQATGDWNKLPAGLRGKIDDLLK